MTKGKNTVGYKFSEDLYVGYNEFKEPLLDAAKFGDIDSVKQRIAEGCDLNETDAEGKSALHIAAEYENLKIVRVLVESKAMLNLRDNAGTMQGQPQSKPQHVLERLK